ncbi:MAG: hypothetical protein EHM49_07385 [Deltaproteobacteria bacterium]|nr:MAG: hypothetical protein EHM49_07385 [Deltaproteobacteria bacterium]
MEELVIVVKQQDCDNGLIALIDALFPECKTSIIFSDMQGNNAYPDESSSELPLSDAGGGTMSDILIMHDQPNMHELFSQKLARAVRSL